MVMSLKQRKIKLKPRIKLNHNIMLYATVKFDLQLLKLIREIDGLVLNI